MRKVVSIITVCFMVITLFSGCAVLQKLGLQKNDDELQPASSLVMNEEEAKKLTDKVPVHLYFASEDNTKLKMEVRYIPVTEAKKSVNNLASTIVKELINGPAKGSPLKSTIPEGTKLRGAVTVKAGTATVDLSKEFVDNHSGGKTAEQLTIYSIVNSLTELKEVQNVKFLVNGKASKEYKGSFQFDAPFPRSVAIISKSPSVSATEIKDKNKSADDKANEKDKNPRPDETKQDNNKQKTTDKAKDSAKNSPADEQAASVDNQNEDSEATYLEILE
ncbi:MAG: GerMN domain-containing protein [Clostridia bacterium]|nr:GerMN domain-containing protein [Clostridia bacterium]